MLNFLTLIQGLKYIAFIFLWILLSVFNPSRAQNDSIPPAPAKVLSASFTKYKTDHSPSEVYFNLLKIENKTISPQTFYVKFNLPDGWNAMLLDNNKEKIVLESGETKTIPLRLSMPKLISGGVAYVISAELLDEQEIPLISPAYCYINIPRNSEWKMRADERYLNISEQELFKPLKVHFENRGNADENLKLNLELGRRIELVGFNSKKIEMGLLLPAYSDTTVEFMVRYISDFSDFPSIKDNKLVVNAKSDDNSPAKSITFWFEKINSRYVNEMKEEESPLVVWADLFNLLTDDGFITLQAGASGTIALPKKQSLRFYLWNGNVFNKNTHRSAGTHFYQYSRMYLVYNKKNLSLRVGDIFSGTWNVPFNGRGISANYKWKNHTLFGAITRNIFNPLWTIGIQDSYKMFGNLTLHGSFGYRLDQTRHVNSIIPTIGATFRYKTSGITALLTPTLVSFNGQNRFGYGHILTYNGFYFNRLRAYINNRYVAKYFIDATGMTMTTIGNINYITKNAQSFTLLYNAIQSNPMSLSSTGILKNLGQRNNQVFNLMYSKSFKKFSMNVGPGYQYYSYDNVISLQPEFVSKNYVAFLSMNARGKKLQNSMSANISLAYTDVTQYTNNITNHQTPYFSSSYVLNFRSNKSGLIFGYYYGAPSYNFQRYYVNSGQGNKSFRINPYINRAFFQNKLNVILNIAYWYQVNDQSTRTNMFSYITYDLGRGWSVNSNVLFYHFSRIDERAIKATFSDVNMNFGCKKTFDLPQPAKKYYDLKVVFFKDLNGNKIKDENEVGIPDIMTGIENAKDSLNIASEEYFTQNLISDQFGTIECIRIPDGKYVISTSELMGTTEYVNQMGKTFDIFLTENLTVYVPFTKSNKIFGKIVIKRDEFSAVAYVSPGNIKVTATDSIGQVHSALTNQDGSFVLYAPQAGAYKIHVNNIFGENFVLRQNDFVVDFNGLKEFSVTFIFEEKKRKINFKGDVNGFDFANKNFNVNGSDSTKNGQISPKTETSGNDKKNEGSEQIESPEKNKNSEKTENTNFRIDKSKIRFKVQLAAYNTNIENPMVDQIRAIPNVEESQTSQGLTRFTLGSYKTLSEAEDKRQEIMSSGQVKEPQFVIIIGEYSGRFLTAEEAQELINN